MSRLHDFLSNGRVAAAGLGGLAAAFLCANLHAATPASGTLDDQHESTAWSGGPYVFPNVTPQTGDPPVCPEYMLTCDEFRFEVNFSSAAGIDPVDDTLKVAIAWNNAEADYDPYLYDDVTGELLVNGGGSSNPETMFVPVRPDGTFNGKYRVVVAPFLPLGEIYTGEVKLERFEGQSAAAKAVTVAEKVGFDIYNPPKPYNTFPADEPTMGINRNDNKVYMIYNSSYLETEFKDDTSPATSVWNDVTGNGRPLIQADPFMGDDEHPLADGSYSPRIWGVGFGLAASDILYSDAPATAAWTRANTASAGLPAGVDNESIASGPYPEGAAFDLLRQVSEAAGARGRAFYYCAHAAVNAFCIRSDDGGLIYKAGRAIFPTSLSCSNHGHVKVGADGSVYVPMNNACNGGQGVSVSVDAGETWTYIRVPHDSAAGSGRWDSSIGLANDGKTLYYGYGEGGTDDAWIVRGTLNKVADPATLAGVRPEIEWGTPVNVGKVLKLRNMVFSTVVAGDPDRAAFAFHGTTTEGDSGTSEFKGVWHLYVALTYDGGANWEIQNVTPGDPTQKGGVCDRGINCPASPPYRNLLDFMDMVTDRDGRVVVGFADGCVDRCVDGNGRPSYSDRGGLARQASGPSLFAARDDQFKGRTADGFATAAPIVTARALNNTVHLSWKAPDDRGSPIQGYRIVRTSGGVTALLAGSASRKPYFVDADVVAGVPYTYTVRAFSALGEGRPSAPVVSSVQAKADSGESVCTPPGLTVVEDAQNDAVAPAPGEATHASQDIEFIAVSEPGAMDDKLVFTLKVRELADPPLPQHRWMVYFTLYDAQDNPTDWYVAMATTDSPTPIFEYGKAATLDTPAAPVGQQVPEGALEPESGYTADGHIALVLDKSKLGGLAPGSLIDLIYAKTRNTTPNDGTQNAGVTRDDTANGVYDVAGNESCRGKAAPVAAFTASRITGTAPVTLTFDASATSAESGTSIARYVWDFGDGSAPVETVDAVVSHRYETDEAYRVKLYVVDSLGQRSNSAKLMVLLGQDSGDAGPLGSSYSVFGGALGAGGLLVLIAIGGLGWGRRRRR